MKYKIKHGTIRLLTALMPLAVSGCYSQTYYPYGNDYGSYSESPTEYGYGSAYGNAYPPGRRCGDAEREKNDDYGDYFRRSNRYRSDYGR
jgi:hypothetical protein